MPMTKQERDELRAKLEGWEDLPIQTGFGNTVCTASQLRELLDGAERAERFRKRMERYAYDPAPLTGQASGYRACAMAAVCDLDPERPLETLPSLPQGEPEG